MTSTTDPADPSSANNDHTTTTGEKPTTAFTAITDRDFLPTLDEAPVAQQARSHLLLLALLAGGVFSAWFMGLELLQPSESTPWWMVGMGFGGIVAGGALLLFWTGSHAIDWWELVSGYWWLSMPVAGAAGLLLVMAQEQSTGYTEVD